MFNDLSQASTSRLQPGFPSVINPNVDNDLKLEESGEASKVSPKAGSAISLDMKRLGPEPLFNYLNFIRNHSDRLATLPKESIGKPVCVIGAGTAGLIAAYELLKMGATPVVFEASNRIGGRTSSVRFDSKDPAAIAERGAMRMPISGGLFFHYADQLNMDASRRVPFTNPGEVDTQLNHGGRTLVWKAKEAPPAEFQKIDQDWSKFVDTLLTPVDEARDIALSTGDFTPLKDVWQKYINQYKDASFSDVIQQHFTDWSESDFELFGTLGVGTGGFKALNDIGFMTLLDVIVNRFEDKQELFIDGIETFAQALYDKKVEQPNGQKVSLSDINAVQLLVPVSHLSQADDGRPLVHFADPSLPARSFSAVIPAMTAPAMEKIGLAAKESLIVEPAKSALSHLHHIKSSKLFICTENKFWKDNPDLPTDIQLQDLPRAVYCLDYPDTDRGVVLVSYTWGGDAIDSQALSPDKMERLAIFKQRISEVNAEFAKKLVPMRGDLDVVSVDWSQEAGYHGAFKLDKPGERSNTSAVYHQFLDVNDPSKDKGVYICGDGVSFYGGWIEGAAHTAIDATLAAAKRLGAEVGENTPLSINKNDYQY